MNWGCDNVKRMREYLFRGKQIDSGEWIEGSLWIHLSKPYIMTTANVVGYEVDPETVGQYTGLKDKNGVRIFEGDIIQYGNSGADRIYWDDELSSFMELRIIGGNEYSCSLVVAEKSEIIGNIHDNPELLKEGGEE
jgi:hypothetical protein